MLTGKTEARLIQEKIPGKYYWQIIAMPRMWCQKRLPVYPKIRTEVYKNIDLFLPC